MTVYFVVNHDWSIICTFFCGGSKKKNKKENTNWTRMKVISVQIFLGNRFFLYFWDIWSLAKKGAFKKFLVWKWIRKYIFLSRCRWGGALKNTCDFLPVPDAFFLEINSSSLRIATQSLWMKKKKEKWELGNEQTLIIENLEKWNDFCEFKSFFLVSISSYRRWPMKAIGSLYSDSWTRRLRNFPFRP